MRISDWSSDVCSSDLAAEARQPRADSRRSETDEQGARLTASGGEMYFPPCAFGLRRWRDPQVELARPGHRFVVLAIELQHRTFEPRSEEHTSELQSIMRIS